MEDSLSSKNGRRHKGISHSVLVDNEIFRTEYLNAILVPPSMRAPCLPGFL